MKYSITSTIPVTDYKCRDIDQLRNIIRGGVKERLPFSEYHSGSSLSPPLPTHVWKPGSLAASVDRTWTSIGYQ